MQLILKKFFISLLHFPDECAIILNSEQGRSYVLGMPILFYDFILY